MVRLVASLMGTYLVAFAATNLVVAGYDDPVPQRSPAPAVAQKGDRIDMAREERSARRIAEVELIGLDDVIVILRDGDGREVYRVDRAANLTIVARDVVFPQLRLNAEMGGELESDLPEPARRAPADLQNDGLGEEAGEDQIFACESGLSALADRKAASLPRVCLSDASGSSDLFPMTSKL